MTGEGGRARSPRGERLRARLRARFVSYRMSMWYLGGEEGRGNLTSPPQHARMYKTSENRRISASHSVPTARTDCCRRGRSHRSVSKPQKLSAWQWMRGIRWLMSFDEALLTSTLHTTSRLSIFNARSLSSMNKWLSMKRGQIMLAASTY